MRKISDILLIGLLLAIAGNVNAQLALVEEHQKQMAMTNLFSLPLAFSKNQGQFGENTLFKANAGRATFYYCRDEVVYLFVRNTDEPLKDDFSSLRDMPGKFDRRRHKNEILLIKAHFIGANSQPEVIGVDRLSHNSSYFYGNDPSKWRTSVPNYSAIIYKDIYPSIDLKYYGDERSMKYDFIVRAGADVSQIKIRYDGVNELSVTPAGDLQAQTRFGLILEKAPYIYQEVGGARLEIAGRYERIESDVFGFIMNEEFNADYPLIIDPELVYSTYLGGNYGEEGSAIAVDGSGYVYITGYTGSSDFPTVNPYDDSLNGPTDVFVSKLVPGGNSLVYSTYLGGNSDDRGNSIAIDGTNCVYITGETNSSDFPTFNPYQTDQGSEDVFITKLAPAGNSLLYSTYLGGSEGDWSYGIAVDASGHAYVTGETNSTDFPTIAPYQTNRPLSDAFVTKLDPAGNTPVYSTYLGGVSQLANDGGHGIAVDGNGFAYVTGYTEAADFPIVNPYQTHQGQYDVFVTKLFPNGSTLAYSTYLGGDSMDEGNDIAVDVDGSAYITGYTASANFPTFNHLLPDLPGNDAFVTKLAPAGNSLVYSTYLGGSGTEWGEGIAVDGNGSACVTGATASSNFFIFHQFQTDQPDFDIFVTKLIPGGNFPIYSTYLGGNGYDRGCAIAIDDYGSTYLTGLTESTDFPIINHYQTNQAMMDAFVTKFGAEGPACNYVTGDVNGSYSFNGFDIVYGVAYLKGGSNPLCLACPAIPDCNTWNYCGDINGSCSYNGLDITYGVNYFKGGPDPFACPDCPSPN